MNALDEAKEIMIKAGCEKAFAIYGIEINDIAEVRSCNNKGESIEVEKAVTNLVPSFEKTLTLDLNNPIECPLNGSFCKYLEFSLKNKTITPHDITTEECQKIKEIILPLLDKYHWKLID
jgi:hypothetical protein